MDFKKIRMKVALSVSSLFLLMNAMYVSLESVREVDRLPTFTCVDDINESRFCPVWKRWGACGYMRKQCAKTCGLCRPQSAPPVPFIPKCARTPYGCCWDNVTVAKGPADDLIKSQCPPCMDRQSKFFCISWRDKCNSKVQGQGDVMRRKCPTTCRVPCSFNMNVVSKNRCEDKEEYRQNCLKWFHEGKCRTHSKHMRWYCPMSCAYCKVTITW